MTLYLTRAHDLYAEEVQSCALDLSVPPGSCIVSEDVSYISVISVVFLVFLLALHFICT